MVNKLLEILIARLGEKKRVIHELEDFTGKSTSTVYRILKGESRLSVNELQSTLEAFGVGWTFFEGDADQAIVVTQMQPASLEENDLLQYMKRLWQELANPVPPYQAAVTVFARDIPLMHYVRMPDLLCFALYDWAHAQGYPDIVHFDQFAVKYRGVCRRMAAGCSWYDARPSVELWNKYTLSSLFNALEFHVGCRMMSAESLVRIQADILSIVTKLQKWVKDGSKDEAGEVSFDLYSSYATLDTNVMNYWYNDRIRDLKTLHAFHHLQSDAFFPDEQVMEARIKGVFARSSSLCATSEVDKAIFFDNLRRQIIDFFSGFKEQ